MSTKFGFCKLKNEDGGSLVEMALSCLVLMPLMFGVIQFSTAFYVYHFVSEAAREGSRYAMVRGNLACTNTPNVDHACDQVSGATVGATPDDIQTFIRGLGYPIAGSVTVGTVWRSYSADSNGHATWTLCANQCSSPGNQVQVTVTDNFPLAIPYWKSLTIPIKSTSTMVISQ
jgi:Flp pilus assembly protein TadG